MAALEGRVELADEIKLRSEQKADEASSSVRATTRAEREAEDQADDTGEVEASDAPAEEEAPAENTEGEPAAS